MRGEKKIEVGKTFPMSDHERMSRYRTWHDAVCRNCTHGDGCQHGLEGEHGNKKLTFGLLSWWTNCGHSIKNIWLSPWECRYFFFFFPCWHNYIIHRVGVFGWLKPSFRLLKCILKGLRAKSLGLVMRTSFSRKISHCVAAKTLVRKSPERLPTRGRTGHEITETWSWN